MKTTKQLLQFRQSMVRYSFSHTITETALRYKVSRGQVYFWRSRYDGTLESLADRSSRPHGHPAQHTDEEITLVINSWRRSPHDGLVLRWIKLRQRGYTRSISGLYRVLCRLGFVSAPLPNPKRYNPKPYEQMQYPGQRVQVDVKYVPRSCISDPYLKLYQFTAIDEFSRFRFCEIYDEHSTHTAALFLDRLIQRFPFRIECIQTDNGSEFVKWKSDPTYRTNPTLFQVTLAQYGIKHKTIKPYTPRHNGKVERSHRKDNEWFYSSHRFYSLDDCRHQFARWLYQYNRLPMSPLHWQSPCDILRKSINECVNRY